MRLAFTIVQRGFPYLGAVVAGWRRRVLEIIVGGASPRRGSIFSGTRNYMSESGIWFLHSLLSFALTRLNQGALRARAFLLLLWREEGRACPRSYPRPRRKGQVELEKVLLNQLSF